MLLQDIPNCSEIPDFKGKKWIVWQNNYSHLIKHFLLGFISNFFAGDVK